MSPIEKHIDSIVNLCKSHKVKSLYVFGSVLTSRFNSDSDIDLIVDFENIALEDYADNYFDLKYSLQTLLQKPVDLLEEKAIKNPFFREKITQQKKIVYMGFE